MSCEDDEYIEGEEENEINDRINGVIKRVNDDMVRKNKGYVAGMRGNVKFIKGELHNKKRDRLSNANIISDVVTVMNVSVKGWLGWCNLKSMKDLTENELSELADRMVGMMEKWIDNDANITEKVTSRIEEEIKSSQLSTDEKKKYVV